MQLSFHVKRMGPIEPAVVEAGALQRDAYVVEDDNDAFAKLQLWPGVKLLREADEAMQTAPGFVYCLCIDHVRHLGQALADACASVTAINMWSSGTVEACLPR
jgi:hypothetical protein